MTDYCWYASYFYDILFEIHIRYLNKLVLWIYILSINNSLLHVKYIIQVQWCQISPASPLFPQLVQNTNKENIKSPWYWPLVKGITQWWFMGFPSSTEMFPLLWRLGVQCGCYHMFLIWMTLSLISDKVSGGSVLKSCPSVAINMNYAHRSP